MIIFFYGCLLKYVQTFVFCLPPGDKAEKEKPLFSVCFENNPLDGKCNQRIVVELQPAEITADMVNSYIYSFLFFCPNVK